jgi:23S rRNA maturation-related 3'-5' exoribonuclease YhaM
MTTTFKSTATAKEKDSILKAFPLISEIKDATLKDMVLETWAQVWRESPYKDLATAPNTSSALGGSQKLVDHVALVGKLALSMAAAMEKVYGPKVNRDVLIADVALHDVDKLVMYERKENKVDGTELGKTIPHGNYGALVAFRVGVPREIVSTVLNHSVFASKVDPTTLEGVLLRYSDHAAFQSDRILSGLPPLHGI